MYYSRTDRCSGGGGLCGLAEWTLLSLNFLIYEMGTLGHQTYMAWLLGLNVITSGHSLTLHVQLRSSPP